MKIGVLDYGAGNLKNVCRAITHLGFHFELISSEEELNTIDKLIIPGVGAFKVAMEQLTILDLVEPIKKIANSGKPILGICLGMQILFETSSEYGNTKGLGLLKGHIELIPNIGALGHKLKVPHIGWNELVIDNDCELTQQLLKDDAVYFVHSYRAHKYEKHNLIAHCIYDGLVLPAIVRNNKIVGCQFHPEKSGTVGLEIFSKFIEEV